MRFDVTVRDSSLALFLAATSLLPAVRNYGTQLGDLPTRPLDAAAALVIALECLPLAVRRRWPAVCLLLVSLGFALDQLLAYHTAGAPRCPSRSSARASIWNVTGASSWPCSPRRTCRWRSRSTGAARPSNWTAM